MRAPANLAKDQEREGLSRVPDGDAHQVQPRCHAPTRVIEQVPLDLRRALGGDPIYDGMRLLRDARFVAPYDTYLAAKFRAAGFICLGKTNTPELGLNGTTEPEAFGRLKLVK